ncbi:MAG: hypothetical protein IKT14_00885, partial [Clostridiales bacterium]|nr:hypothetical protein [Clostridiales bacterium]
IINTFRFWGNIGTMIVAFFRIVGGMTTARMNILSVGGVCVSLYFVLTVLLIVAGGFVTKKKRNEKPEHQIILSVFWGNLILFTICDTRWGDDNFSYRYLIVAFLITVICLGLFLDDVLYEKWGRGFLVISMAVCLLVVNTYSFLLIYNEKNNYEDLMEMAEFFDSKDPEVVLFYGDKTVYVDGRNLRVLDLTKVYKTVLTGDDFPTHIGDTLKYDYDYEGSYIIVSKKDDFNSLPAHVREGSSVLSEDLKGYYVVQYDGSIPEFF